MSALAQVYSKAWARKGFCDQLFDFGCRPALATGIGRVQTVVGQHGVDFVWNSGDQAQQEVSCDGRGSLLVQFGEDELRSSVNGHKEVEPPLLGADLGDIDVEVADRVGLELALPGLAVFDVRQPRDAVAPRKRPQALLTMLYRSTDRLCRCGAAVKNLSHSASFESGDKGAPSNPGIKQGGAMSLI
jgi:hypothetical protein